MRTCLLKNHSSVNEDLYQVTLQNHADYAGRHGYDIISLNRTYQEAWWGCLDWVRDALEHYDRVLTIGSDVIFARPEMSLDIFDDNAHSVFIQNEGLVYPTLNFDMVIWTTKNDPHGVEEVIKELERRKPEYENHRFGLQEGISMVAKDPAMAKYIRIMPPRSMQSAPYCGHPGSWEKGDFAVHFLGMSNQDKLMCARHYLMTRQVLCRIRR